MTASSLSALVAGVLCAAGLAGCAACDPLALACGGDADCPGTTCRAGACTAAPAHVDGGTPAEGEGEGARSEGEGTASEGEGTAGEGEGAASEGEGTASEGEGTASEGEGATSEGEGATSEGEGGEGEGGEGEGEGGGPSPASCLDVLAANPGAADGVYPIGVDGNEVNVECDMTNGGFALLFRYDAGDPCPGAFAAGPNGGCVRITDQRQTSAFVTPPYPFREMRGVVHALGFGGSDAFRDQEQAPPSIDAQYVDGFTITVGSPRVHVFTFAHATTDVFGCPAPACCPCDGGNVSPSFVGTDFLCEQPRESVQPGNTGVRFYDTSDVLFDGQDIDNASCRDDPSSAPSFTRDLGVVESGDVELRLMSSEGTANEDTQLIHADLWIR